MQKMVLIENGRIQETGSHRKW
jgi:hypothetical protein